MGEKARQPPNSVAIELQSVGFGRRMFFNRFAVVPDGDFRLMHFGYMPSPNLIGDHFAVAVHCSSLEAQRKEVLDYLGRLGDLALPEPDRWLPPASGYQVDLVNHLGFCRRGSESEIALHNFSVKALMDLAKASKPNMVIPSEAIALLRSDVEVQKHLVRALYPLE